MMYTCKTHMSIVIHASMIFRAHGRCWGLRQRRSGWWWTRAVRLSSRGPLTSSACWARYARPANEKCTFARWRSCTGAASQQTYKADREGRHVHLHVGGRALALHQYPSACAFDESQCCRYVLFDFLVLTRAAVAGEGRGRGHGAAGRVRLLGCRDAGALDRRSSIFVCVYM